MEIQVELGMDSGEALTVQIIKVFFLNESYDEVQFLPTYSIPQSFFQVANRDQWDPKNEIHEKKKDDLPQVPCNFKCISAVFTKNVARLGSPKPDSVVLVA